MTGILYWITGLSGAGKTTIGTSLYYALREKGEPVVLLDGDIMKRLFSDSPGYDIESRRHRAMQYSRLCKMLTDQGITVVCCTVAMFHAVRQWNREKIDNYVEIYLNVPIDVLKKRDKKGLYSGYQKGTENSIAGIDISVEFPDNPDIELMNDGSVAISECVDRILSYQVRANDNEFQRDVNYWNRYYLEKRAPEEPSIFAKDIIGQLETGSSMLELGCGNGRDAVFFARNGLQVTAIDASDDGIKECRKQYGNENGLIFLCDDFCRSTALFMRQYDYIYSRFTLHAISEEQQEDVLKNVFYALKNGGKFYIEVRSIHDELFKMGKRVTDNAFIYNGHYRRFLVKEELENQLKMVGFSVIYAEESRLFAPAEGQAPPVIRITAQKGMAELYEA